MRSGFILVVSILIMAGMIAGSPIPTEAGKKRSKTVSRTFSNESATVIPAGAGVEQSSPYPSEIQVSGFKKGKTLDVNVRLNGFNHEYPRDVDVLLVAPNGQSIMLMSDAGGIGATPFAVVNAQFTIDDQAEQPFPDSTAPGGIPSGTFRPTNIDSAGDEAAFPGPAPTSGAAAELAAINGSNPNGSWRLFVVDDNDDEDTGEIDGWSLEIRAKVKVKKKNK
jgi:subtilisin-like proprotein convertase family protein